MLRDEGCGHDQVIAFKRRTEGLSAQETAPLGTGNDNDAASPRRPVWQRRDILNHLRALSDECAALALAIDCSTLAGLYRLAAEEADRRNSARQ